MYGWMSRPMNSSERSKECESGLYILYYITLYHSICDESICIFDGFSEVFLCGIGSSPYELLVSDRILVQIFLMLDNLATPPRSQLIQLNGN